MDDRIVEIILLVSCYAEMIEHKIQIGSLTHFRDIVNFVYFPCNLMTKYGHESGSITISQLQSFPSLTAGQ